MAKIDERYKRGQVYTIRCRYDNELIYVGSTINPLSKRMYSHRGDGLTRCSNLYKLVANDWDSWYIELYENYPCNSKQELEKREGEVIREIATINNRIEGRTAKERYKDNHDKILEERKVYRNANSEKIAIKKQRKPPAIYVVVKLQKTT